MSRITTKKAFYCLEFKWQVQEKINEDIKDMSYAEQIVYFQEKIANSSLNNWWQAINLT